MRGTTSSLMVGLFAATLSFGAAGPASAGLIAQWHFDEAPGSSGTADRAEDAT